MCVLHKYNVYMYSAKYTHVVMSICIKCARVEVVQWWKAVPHCPLTEPQAPMWKCFEFPAEDGRLIKADDGQEGGELVFTAKFVLDFEEMLASVETAAIVSILQLVVVIQIYM